MDEIEIPEVHEPPARNRAEAEPLALFAFLFTALLPHPWAVLHAERGDAAGEVTWWLRRRRADGAEGPDVPLAVTPAGMFRSVAGRLAVLAGIDHTNGGHARVVLTQAGRRRDCRVFLSNCRASGLWLRVYTWQFAASGPAVPPPADSAG